MRADRGGHSGDRRNRADHFDRVRRHGQRHDRGRARGRFAARARRHQDPRRRHRHLSGGNRKTNHPRDDRQEPGHRPGGVGLGRRALAEDGGRPDSQRPVRNTLDLARRDLERAPLRNLHRSVGDGAAPPRAHLRRRGRRRAPLVARPAGRLGAQRQRRDSAPHDRPGVPRRRVREPRAAHARRRHTPGAGRGGDGRRRFRRDRPVRALRRRSHRADLRLPDRRPERARHRRQRSRVRRADPADAARGHLSHGLAGPVDDTPGPARNHVPERPGRVRAGIPGARPVPGAAAGVLGQPRHSHFVPRRHRTDARARRDGERHLAVRLHPGAGHRGRRRHHRRRERLRASGRARRGIARRDRGRPGDCDTRRLRRPDDRRGVRAPVVRTGPDGQGLPRHTAGGHPLPALFAD